MWNSWTPQAAPIGIANSPELAFHLSRCLPLQANLKSIQSMK